MSNLYYGNRYTFLQNNNIKFYIAEPKTPLDNQLQYKSHIVRNLFLPRLNKPEELRQFGHPKSPQPYWQMKINRLNNQSKIKTNLTQKLLHYRKNNSKDIVQLRVSVVTRNTRQQREHVENPDD